MFCSNSNEKYGVNEEMLRQHPLLSKDTVIINKYASEKGLPISTSDQALGVTRFMQRVVYLGAFVVPEILLLLPLFSQTYKEFVRLYLYRSMWLIPLFVYWIVYAVLLLYLSARSCRHSILYQRDPRLCCVLSRGKSLILNSVLVFISLNIGILVVAVAVVLVVVSGKYLFNLVM